MTEHPSQAIKIFYCYAHKDRIWRDELNRHLMIFKRSGKIIDWCDQEIQPGIEWEREVETQLDQADIILLLVSSDFIASEYCYTKEMQHALEMHKEGRACVIPVILREVLWENALFASLQILPEGGKPVYSWSDRDAALKNVAQGVGKVITALLDQKREQTKQARTLLDTDRKALLQLLADTENGRVFSIQKPVTTIGRAPDNDVQIDHPTVSRHHAQIVNRGTQWSFEKQREASKNTITVNGREIQQAIVLHDGDQLGLGPEVLFRWVLE